ncbi:DUF4432 family protein [Paenibacillus oryzisoli]|uniref:DUF4432 family protein n=1 Tax=Paenibacillus oryzisoli TaxID=1850517 RepID=UPI003D2C97A4
MENTVTIHVSDLREQEIRHLPQGGSVKKWSISDAVHAELPVIQIHNGYLAFTVLPARGMEIGEIRNEEELMSWERSSTFLQHPEHVSLQERQGTGWLNGFYSAVATIGPELFGTPGEGLTLHGTSSYSPARSDTIRITYGTEGIWIEGEVVCAGYGDKPLFVKQIRIFTAWHTSLLLREEFTENISSEVQTLDDGYHIQLSGSYLYGGGRYVLPAKRESLLIRDGAPREDDPLRIPSRDEGPQPIRCYQYVPEPVCGLVHIDELGAYIGKLQSRELTAEMMVDHGNHAAGFIIRPLSSYPRSLIAKEIGESFMFSFEPCRTRPNRMSQKHIDGEAFILLPGAGAFTQCIIGVTKKVSTIEALEKCIVQR